MLIANGADARHHHHGVRQCRPRCRRRATCSRRWPSPAPTSRCTRAPTGRWSQPIIDAKYVHGEDGLGGAPRPATHANAARPTMRVGVLRQDLPRGGRRGEKVDILMIGPLTNLALALRLDPAIIDGHRHAHHHGRHGLWPRQHHAGGRVQHLCRPRSGAGRLLGRASTSWSCPGSPASTHSMTGDATRCAVRRRCPPTPARDVLPGAGDQHARRNGVRLGRSRQLPLCRSAGRRRAARSRRSSRKSIAASIRRRAGAGDHPRHDRGRSFRPLGTPKDYARRGGRSSTGSTPSTPYPPPIVQQEH